MSKDDKLLNTLIKNLEADFRSFRKEVSKYQHVVDITRVDAFTKKKITSLLNSRFPHLKDYETWGTQVVGKNTTNFLVLTSRKQLEAVSDVIQNADDDDYESFEKEGFSTGFTQNRSQGPASQKRQEEFILERSTAAKGKLSSLITAKTKQYLAFASPEFTALFIDKVDKRLNEYTFEFNLPDELKGGLRDKLFSSVTETFNKELRSLKPKTVLNDAIEERVHNLGVAFETGKTTKSVKTRTRKKVKSSKKINTTKTYYTRLRSTSGGFLSAPSLQATLNILLHDTIETEFMEDSAAPRDRDYLRYQSGRFARSAKVDMVNYSSVGDGRLDIQYDYMTNPYETFTKINQYNGPGRNPENIISAAIRSILVRTVGDQFQANIRKS